MRYPSRLIALFSSLLLVGLVLVTSGFACDRSSRPGMAMSGMNMGANRTDANLSAPENSKLPTVPCRFPWAPDGCQSMIPCAQAAIVSAGSNLEFSVGPSHNAISLVTLTPPSEHPAPELPPPRA